jgi:hypothetical protein
MSTTLESAPVIGSRLDHLEWLEAEAIYILREVAAQCEKPALLFSGGKDSCVLLRLAEKAFRPGAFPFPLLHIDTGHNFTEVLEFRDARAAALNEKLIVRSVEDSIARGTVKLRDELDSTASASGTPRISAPSCGICTTPASSPARTSASSRSPTGPSLTSGSTSGGKGCRCRACTSPISARWSGDVACWCR